jgi:hypothetical protein
MRSHLLEYKCSLIATHISPTVSERAASPGYKDSQHHEAGSVAIPIMFCQKLLGVQGRSMAHRRKSKSHRQDGFHHTREV